MVLRHIREELAEARARDLGLEEKLKARYAILIAAAAIAPLTAAMWVALLLLWKHVGMPPDLAVNGAFLYPLSAVAGALLAMPLHKHAYYFLATVLAVAPLLGVLAFLVGMAAWIFGVTL